MHKSIINHLTAAVAALALIPTALAQTGLEKRAAIEAEFGVKDAVVRYDTRADMMKELYRTGAEYYMYPFDNPEMTPAPKGYKPFYISYLGRHGARFAISDDIYEKMRAILVNAHEAGKLNGKGEELYRRYEAFYPHVAFRGGDLTIKGQEQLHKIANIMYHDFPEVFKGKTEATVLSTPVPRVLLTMHSFIDEIRVLDRDFSYSVDAGRTFLPVLEPNGSKNPFYEKVPRTKAVAETAAAMQAELADPEEFCSRFFNDIDFVESSYGMWKFESDMRSIIMDIQCIGDDAATDKFDDIFTPEELFNLWELRNYNGYTIWGFSPIADNRSVTNNAAVLKDIMVNADRNIASGKVRLDLRFTHDTAVLPTASFMRINNFGAVISEPHEVKNYWRSDQIPMASNIQFIFYRSRKSSEILIKVLYNGHEASLPLAEVAPSYYSWNAFRDFYYKLIEDVKKDILDFHLRSIVSI